MYTYRCIINKVVDGDTVDIDLDLGFGIWLRNERVRIVGIDTPETRTRDLEEKKLGLAATDRARELLAEGSEQILLSKDFKGKFGRILGDFKLGDTTFSQTMLNENYAVVYK